MHPTNPSKEVLPKKLYKNKAAESNPPADDALPSEYDLNLADQLNDQSSSVDPKDQEVSEVQPERDPTRDQGMAAMREQLREGSRGHRLDQPSGQDSPGRHASNGDNDRDEPPYRASPGNGKTRYQEEPDAQMEDNQQKGPNPDPDSPFSGRHGYKQGRHETDFDPAKSLLPDDQGEPEDDLYGDEDLVDVQDDVDSPDYGRHQEMYRGDDRRPVKNGNPGRSDLFGDSKAVNDVEDREIPRQPEADGVSDDDRMISDHDMGMAHPEDVAAAQRDSYQRQDGDSPGDKVDVTSNWGSPKKQETFPSTERPPRRIYSHSNARPGTTYNSDYYSYYYPAYGNNWPHNRNAQDPYGRRNQQNPQYVPSRNSGRGFGNRNGVSNRQGSNILSGRHYNKVSDSTRSWENDHRNRAGYNSEYNHVCTGFQQHAFMLQ